MKGLAWMRSVWRAVRRPKQLNAGMNAEMRFHIEMEAERLEQTGLSKEDAMRQAHVRFGGLEKYKEEARDARALPWIDAVSVDAKLGARMLWKHRGLTLVGGFALAVAIAIGATFYEVLSEVSSPALPLPDGSRIVAVHFATDIPGSPERHILHDFVSLRRQLSSIVELGAFRTVQHNLVTPNRSAEPVKVAEMSAAGFTVARTAPLLGRYLLSTDEAAAAPSVVVIGYNAWKTRFSGDPSIVGSTINLGGTPSVIVGVMPAKFAFPIDHQFWIPLRQNPLDYKLLEGPELTMFGRLADKATLSQAQAELTTIGQRLAAAQPQTHARLRPTVVPYVGEYSGLVTPSRVWLVMIAKLLVGALAFVVAVNLSILIYARTVTRMGEIAIRTALGASRSRILSQLFMESFALSLVGAAGGLAIASAALGLVHNFLFIGGGAPFWLRYELSFGTGLYAVILAAATAFVMGVVPGLKATGRGLNANLHELNGRTGTRLGPMWTTMVVAQIAVAVAVLPGSAYLSWLVVRTELVGAGFSTEKFVVSVAAMSDDADTVESGRLAARQKELMAKIAAEPGVTAVTFSSGVPGFGPGGRVVEFGDAKSDDDAEVSYLDVSLDMLDTYDAQMVMGRGFNARDLGAANSVIVNQTFAKKFLADRNPIGERFRYRGLEGERVIVGVVRDFPQFPPSVTLDGEPVVYQPASPGDLQTFVISAKYSGPVQAAETEKSVVTERFRQLAVGVDPALQLRRVVPLSLYYTNVRSIWRFLAVGIGLLTSSVLLLSAAGIYSLMSLTVAQRTREIGIRSALGATPRGLIRNILGRSVRQITIGLVIGSMLSGAVFVANNFAASQATILIGSVAIMMLLVGVFAALGPARRLLKIQATEALRAD
jgi:predicted permease